MAIELTLRSKATFRDLCSSYIHGSLWEGQKGAIDILRHSHRFSGIGLILVFAYYLARGRISAGIPLHVTCMHRKGYVMTSGKGWLMHP